MKWVKLKLIIDSWLIHVFDLHLYFVHICFFAGILVITVATEETDGFKRFMMSANKHKLNVKVRQM